MDLASKMDAIAAAGESTIRADVAALRAHGVDSWERLVATVHAGDPALRARAVWLLGRLDGEDAGPPLAVALADDTAAVRAEAARSLATLGDPRSAPRLIELLASDPDDDVRVACAYALGLMPDEVGTDALARTLADRLQPVRVRAMAAESLVGADATRATPALLEGLVDAAAEVRFWSAFAVGENDVAAATPILRQMARDDRGTTDHGDVAAEAAAALARIGRPHP